MAIVAGQHLAAASLNELAPASVDATASSATTTVSTTAANLAGATVTFYTPTTNTVILVHGIFDVESSGGTDIFTGLCLIDGSPQSAQAIYFNTGRATVTQIWRSTLSASGQHTCLLRVQKVNNSNTVTVYGTHSRIIVTANGI